MQPTHIVSFGRRRGRKLHTSHSALVETLLPELRIRLPDGSIDLASVFAGGAENLWVEIGFGGGEHLVEQARRHPGIRFIGCEPYINGMSKLLAAIERDGLRNIRLLDDDARPLLEKLPDASIDRIFVLFPDPWPKNRHHKRRLISQTTLALFYAKLKPGGVLRLATDHEDYCVWMLEQLLQFGRFRWTAKTCEDWESPPADWVPTRYQAKAKAEGRETIYLEWAKSDLEHDGALLRRSMR